MTRCRFLRLWRLWMMTCCWDRLYRPWFLARPSVLPSPQCRSPSYCCSVDERLVNMWRRGKRQSHNLSSSGSSGRVRGTGKHEIYAAAFGGHLFYDLFSQDRGGGGMAPSVSLPGSTTVKGPFTPSVSDDANNSVLVENNGVIWKWVATPIWSDFIVFNENTIASIIAKSSQHWHRRLV